MKSVLITGGAGFIGSHLAEFYLKHKYKVIVLDDLSTGSIDNVIHLKGDRNFSLIIDSVLKNKIINELTKKVDIVVHLAAAVGVNYIIDNPLKSLEINIEGTDNILKSCNKYKKKVMIASSSEVYGKNEKVPFSEKDSSVIGPITISRWSYACSKAIDEFFALAYYREKNLPVVIMRFFNTCGPRQTGRYGMVIPRFVKQALTNKPITIYGDGKQTRCFSHIYDVVKYVYSLSIDDRANGEIFNIGSTERIKIVDLAKLVVKRANSKSRITFVPYEDAFEKGFEDMRHRVPDISKIVKLTGFKHEKRLTDIIDDVIEYYRR
ncbi:MAG: GDP-mannose 4,6-dehydratase [Candidatus Hydrogenedentota bacterium]